MQNRTLQMKRVLRIALLVLLLGAFGTGNVFADGYDYAEVCPSGQMLFDKSDPDDDGYDYAEVCPSGQTLYYKIIEDNPNSVMVVPPYYYKDNTPYGGEIFFEFWQGYEKPSGDVIIPETLSNGMVVKKIGKTRNAVYYDYGFLGAFEGCTGVTSVVIPNTVTFIDGNAFSDCTGLVSVTIGNSVACIGLDNEQVMGFYSGPFEGCTSLSSIEFGNALKFIGLVAFRGCTSLTSVTFPNSLTTIDYKAFMDCSNLSSISLPSSLIEIAYSAFNGTKWYEEQDDGILYLGTYCMGYKGDKPEGNLSISEGTKVVACNAFACCENLTAVTFPNSLTAIGKRAFGLCNRLNSVSLPNSLAFIGEDVFGECESLTSITIPKSVTNIGKYAFSNCLHLISVYYNAENAMGEEAFPRCTGLASITIGSDVKRIDGNIFKECNTVHLVVALGETPAALDPEAFSDLAENAMLMVPCGKKITYFSQWSTFPYDNIIENCDQYTVSMSGVGPGGSITPSTTNAQMGEEVLLTVTPNVGMALESIAICNANDPTQTIPYYFPGKATSTIGFIMPQFGVTVKAVFKISGASVEENDGIAATVYPNPTNGLIKIEAVGLKHISISNLFGQCIYEGNANGDEFNYDFSRHKAGIYLIRIGTASGIALKKVSVVR